MNDFGFGTAFVTHLKCFLIHFLCISALNHFGLIWASRDGVKQFRRCIEQRYNDSVKSNYARRRSFIGSSLLSLLLALGVSSISLLLEISEEGFLLLLGELLVGVIEVLGSLESVGLLLNVLLLGLVISLSLEEVGVSQGDAQEVRPQSDDDDGEEELSEDVVLLLELHVVLLGGAPAVVDGVLLVDPHEVDDGPDGNEGGGHNDHDAAAEESATGADAVLAEPDDEERSGDVGGDEQEQVDERVPPGDQIVQHEEELAGDLHSGEHDSEDADGHDTSLDGDDAAARDTVGGLVVAQADAAAALREDGLALLLVEGAELLGLIGSLEGVLDLGHGEQLVTLFALLLFLFILLLFSFLIFVGILVLVTFGFGRRLFSGGGISITTVIEELVVLLSMQVLVSLAHSDLIL